MYTCTFIECFKLHAVTIAPEGADHSTAITKIFSENGYSMDWTRASGTN